MCYLAGIIVVVALFFPPLDLALIWWPQEGLWQPLGVAVAAWLILWFVLSAIIRLVGLPGPERWTMRLLSGSHPSAVTLAPWIAILLVLVFGLGGLSILNATLKTSFVLPPRAILLALFACVVELARLFETAALDERLWCANHRGSASPATEG